MKKCYHCGTSFEHEGDPIDGNDFCNHKCSANYIEQVKQVEKCEEHFKNLPLGMKSDAYRLKPDPRVNEAEGYYDQHDENCDKEGCSECEEAEAGRAEYEAENAIANQRERYEADQEAIPKNWNGE